MIWGAILVTRKGINCKTTDQSHNLGKVYAMEKKISIKAKLLIETSALYKTKKCPDGAQCQKTQCWSYHNEFEKRRFYPYPIGHGLENCVDFEKGHCMDENCQKVHYVHPHGTNEALYHPFNYKGKDRFCKREASNGCKWSEQNTVHLCPFLHKNEEIPPEIQDWEVWEGLIIQCIDAYKKREKNPTMIVSTPVVKKKKSEHKSEDKGEFDLAIQGMHVQVNVEIRRKSIV
jgi:hypothetical protein